MCVELSSQNYFAIKKIKFYENEKSVLKCNVDTEHFLRSPFGRLVAALLHDSILFLLFNIERDVIFNNSLHEALKKWYCSKYF